MTRPGELPASDRAGAPAQLPPGAADGDLQRARDELARQQAGLVAALVAGAAPPAGMDAARIEVQAAALIRKRARAAAHVQPQLAAVLDAAFWPEFSRYAAGTPSPGSAGADAAQFAGSLRTGGRRFDRATRRAAQRVARHWARVAGR